MRCGAIAQSDAALHHSGPPVTPVSQPAPSLRVSQRIAAARAAETRRSRSEGPSSETGNGVDGRLFLDPYAELLAGWPNHTGGLDPATAAKDAATVAQDVVATAHLDRLLLNATAIAAVNRITQGDYRQVVLLGDAMDTRPFRLPLPPGVVIYVVAPGEAHAAAQAALSSEAAVAIAEAVAAESQVQARTRTQVQDAGPDSSSSSNSSAAAEPGSGTEESSVSAAEDEERSASASSDTASTSGRAGGGGDGRPAGDKARSRSARLRGPRPPPGCVVRRVAVDLQSGAFSLLSALEAAGFRADRLSVWVVQGLAGLGMAQEEVVSLLAEAAHCAAYHSLLVGELPAMGADQAANTLAECGLLGAPTAFGTPDTSYGRWRPEWGPPADPQSPQRWLFASQQIRLSAAQMDTYSAHREAAEGLDEDFFDNFS